MPVGHLYLLEKCLFRSSAQFLRIFKNIIIIWAVCIFWKLSSHWSPGLQIYIFLLSLQAVLFHLLFPLLYKSLYIWLFPICSFLLLFLLPWETEGNLSWFTSANFLPMFSPRVLWCHVLHLLFKSWHSILSTDFVVKYFYSYILYRNLNPNCSLISWLTIQP